MRKIIPVLASAALVLAGCAQAEKKADAQGLNVIASFYPLEYLSQKIGGDKVSVTSLTPKGGHSHDLEIAPADVAKLSSADLVVYLSGFQPSVDKAVEETSPKNVYDAAADADLVEASAHTVEQADIPGIDGDHEGHDHEGHDHEGHDHEGHDHDYEATASASPVEEGHDHEGHDHEGHDHDHESHDHGGKDPHFWLDPARMAVVTTKLGDAFAKADPSNADTYQANAKKLAEELTALEDEYKQGLATCKRDTIVVSHSAYGYLTEDFHIHQVGMAGVDPEAEPAPATLAAVKKVMADKNITTIFTEHLINPKAAEQFAQETGAKTAVLDPIENQNDEAKDYQVVMRDNLEALRTALECK